MKQKELDYDEMNNSLQQFKETTTVPKEFDGMFFMTGNGRLSLHFLILDPEEDHGFEKNEFGWYKFQVVLMTHGTDPKIESFEAIIGDPMEYAKHQMSGHHGVILKKCNRSNHILQGMFGIFQAAKDNILKMAVQPAE